MCFRILKTASYIPEKKIDNNHFSYFGKDSEWIKERTGINTRYYSEDSNVFMAVNAAKKAVEGIEKDRIKLIIVATFTPDNLTPSTACIIQKELGLGEDVMAFDLNAACSGFVYALKVADSIIKDTNDYALIIGSEKISSVLDKNDLGTSIIFGDGSGAVVIKPSKNKTIFDIGSKGDEEKIKCQVGKNLFMAGKDVFKFAVSTSPISINKALDKANLKAEDIDYFVLHQANARIIKSISKRLNVEEEKFFVNIDKYANTSAASIPIALDELNMKNKLKKGMKILLCGFGSGLTWGSLVMEW